MDFELSEELVAVRDLARDFAEKEIAPSAAKDDKEHAFRRDLILKMGELGFYGAVIPESYGGPGARMSAASPLPSRTRDRTWPRSEPPLRATAIAMCSMAAKSGSPTR